MNNVQAQDCIADYGNIVGAIHISKTDPTLLVALGRRPLISNDGGTTWQRGRLLFDGGIGTDIETTQDAIYFTYFFRGVFKSTNGGRNWAEVLDAQRAIKIIASPNNPNRVYVLDEFSGIFRTDNGGNTWENILTPAGINTLGSEFLTSMDVANEGANDVLYVGAANPGGLFRSEDQGTNWVPLGSPADWGDSLNSVAAARDNPDLLFAGSNVSLFRSTNRGLDWASVSDVLGNSTSFTFDARSLSSTSNQFLFRSPSHLFRSTNQGESVERFPEPVSEDPRFAVFFKASMDATESGDEIYVSMEPNTIPTDPNFCHHLWKSTDGGQSWVQISSEAIDFPSEGTVLTPIYLLLQEE